MEHLPSFPLRTAARTVRGPPQARERADGRRTEYGVSRPAPNPARTKVSLAAVTAAREPSARIALGPVFERTLAARRCSKRAKQVLMNVAAPGVVGKHG